MNFINFTRSTWACKWEWLPFIIWECSYLNGTNFRGTKFRSFIFFAKKMLFAGINFRGWLVTTYLRQKKATASYLSKGWKIP